MSELVDDVGDVVLPVQNPVAPDETPVSVVIPRWAAEVLADPEGHTTGDIGDAQIALRAVL